MGEEISKNGSVGENKGREMIVFQKQESKARETADFGYEENIGGSLDERLGMSRNPTG